MVYIHLLNVNHILFPFKPVSSHKINITLKFWIPKWNLHRKHDCISRTLLTDFIFFQWPSHRSSRDRMGPKTDIQQGMHGKSNLLTHCDFVITECKLCNFCNPPKTYSVLALWIWTSKVQVMQTPLLQPLFWWRFLFLVADDNWAGAGKWHEGQAEWQIVEVNISHISIDLQMSNTWRSMQSVSRVKQIRSMYAYMYVLALQLHNYKSWTCQTLNYTHTCCRCKESGGDNLVMHC